MSAILAIIQDELKQRHHTDNAAILSRRIEAYDRVIGPRVGDYLEFEGGEYYRIAHHWGDAIQPTYLRGDSGSFYLGDGYMEYSGSLDSAIPVERLEATEQKRDGQVWFFDLNVSGAGRGVRFSAPFRVFRVKA